MFFSLNARLIPFPWPVLLHLLSVWYFFIIWYLTYLKNPNTLTRYHTYLNILNKSIWQPVSKCSLINDGVDPDKTPRSEHWTRSYSVCRMFRVNTVISKSIMILYPFFGSETYICILATEYTATLRIDCPSRAQTYCKGKVLKNSYILGIAH